MRTALNGHTPGHLAHRRKQRKAAARICNSFICNTGRTRSDEIFSLFRVWGQMQISVENLVRPQKFALTNLWFFHFDDHLCLGENFSRSLRNRCTCVFIILVSAANASAGIFLHHHLVAMAHIFANRLRG